MEFDWMKKKSARWHTIYSIISSLIQEAGVALLFLWLLPIFGIVVPLWAVILFLLGFAVFCYVMYRIGHPTILFKEVSAPESIVGQTGVVERSLNPEGYVKVYGELWRASATNGPIKKGEEVVITAIDGLKLTVGRKS
jgi:membrane protein implicated in regulation of membrane protease activity